VDHSTEETIVYDQKILAKFKRLGELAPEASRAFMVFDAATFAGLRQDRVGHPSPPCRARSEENGRGP
jgi:hypothetical protein